MGSNSSKQEIITNIENTISTLTVNETTLNNLTDVYNEVVNETLLSDSQSCTSNTLNLNKIDWGNIDAEGCDLNILQSITSEIKNKCKQIGSIDSSKIAKISNDFSSKVSEMIKNSSDNSIKQLIKNAQNNKKIRDKLPNFDLADILSSFNSNNIDQKSITNIKNKISNTVKNKFTQNINTKLSNVVKNKSQIQSFKECVLDVTNNNIANFGNLKIKCRPGQKFNIEQNIYNKIFNECLQSNKIVKETVTDVLGQIENVIDKKTTTKNKSATDTIVDTEQKNKNVKTFFGISGMSDPLFILGSSISSFIFILFIVFIIVIFILNK